MAACVRSFCSRVNCTAVGLPKGVDFGGQPSRPRSPGASSEVGPGARSRTAPAPSGLRADRLVAIVDHASDTRTEIAYDGASRWCRFRLYDIVGTPTLVETRHFVWDGLSLAKCRILDGSGNFVEERTYFGSGEVRHAVYGLVARELGAAALARFIQENYPGHGDYTADRQRQEQPDVDQIMEEVRKRSRS